MLNHVIGNPFHPGGENLDDSYTNAELEIEAGTHLQHSKPAKHNIKERDMF